MSYLPMQVGLFVSLTYSSVSNKGRGVRKIFEFLISERGCGINGGVYTSRKKLTLKSI